ncbi:dolichol-P-glucose synthetase homolog [Alloactinosynnema sp. L-07]|uniref:lysylphosphatidylglycerol synthase transmembrane domain-containing protein n=1 Tax=Alloactinosynnema sp. L-07 TaxID=1653480 RepID=UPI00065F01C0|nr:lysylphosphatidylglycerol synthase transmembrane domain-containing protein [Alloactinosynnema sp. L-07]CRK55060.1 dolichol-P-glucose synthetase homolog [Alloactinosynnema sp. L-07]
MKRLWPWLRLGLAVAVLVGLGLRLGTDAFLDGLRAAAGWPVVAALAIGGLTTVASAWRWCLISRRLGLPLNLRTAVADYYRALLLNAVLPAGVLGDVHRAVSHGKQSGDVGRGVRAVVFERTAGQLVLVAIGLVVVFTQPIRGLDLVPSADVVIACLIALTVAVGVAARAPRVREVLRATWADLRVGVLDRAALPHLVTLSAAAVAGHVALFIVAARAAGSTAPVGTLVPLIILALLVMAVPINVGGFGPREAFLAVAFGAAGLGAAQGLTTAVVYGVLALVASLPGILVVLPVKRREVPRERRDQPGQQVLAFAG